MRIGLYTKRFSAHVLPFARNLLGQAGEDCFRYVWREDLREGRRAIGWKPAMEIPGGCMDAELEEWVENCDVLYCGYRKWQLWQRRSRKGLTTYYIGERWMEPWDIPVPARWLRCDGWWFNWSGWVRWLRPGFRRLVRATAELVQTDPNFKILAIGPWARMDLMRLGVPKDRIGSWAYQVEGDDKSTLKSPRLSTGLRVLWVGRMIGWKHADSVIRAVKALRQNGRDRISLTLVGDGPKRKRLERLVGEADGFQFLGMLQHDEIRAVMRKHDVLVLSSDGNEGWGVVVNEAKAEGLQTICTWEAGCHEIVDPADRFHAGDWRGLARILGRMEGTLKVVHAIAGIVDRSSGIVRNTLALDAALRKAGVDSRICTSIRELKQVADADAILHVHNSWMPIVMATADIKRKTGCRLVVSPRGSMSDWALCKSKWKKRIVWFLGMRKVWARADAFVATSEKEKDEIVARQKRMGIQRPVEAVRLGCELGQMRSRQNPKDRELHVLYLGRIEPVKGLDRLLDQMKGMKNVQLRIAGPSIGGYGEILRWRDAPAPTEPQALKVEFLGEVHGEAKESAFDWADVLVLPSYSENFGSVVVEALSRGVPVIASRGTPWQEVEDVGCGWWTDDFRTAVESARQSDLVAMGVKGNEWVRKAFTWDGCAVRLKEFYPSI